MTAKTAPIYARLLGGLGNQLFQYATARATALRAGTELMLDARLLNPDGPFQYSLQHFAIEASIGREDELPPSKAKPIRHALWRTFGRNPRFLREQGLGFNPSVIEAGPDTYLHGYFQTELYFRDFEQQIRQELTTRTPPDAVNTALLEEIAAEPAAVSLHVRRGDYMSNSKASATHGTCSPAYYENAARLIAERTGTDPVLFVFSDDIVWVRENMQLPFERRVVDANDFTRNYADLRLMAACRHNIVANSTFSWWGGWLNPKPDKIVIAPRRWFADSKLSNPDILPEAWIMSGD